MAANWSYEEACEQAYKLRKQGLSYPKIAEHFQKSGYKSPKTKDYVGHLTARHMAEVFKKELEEEQREELKDEKLIEKKLLVTSPVQDTLYAVEQLLSMEGIPDKVKINLVNNYIKESRANREPKGPASKGQNTKRRGRPPSKRGGNSGHQNI